MRRWAGALLLLVPACASEPADRAHGFARAVVNAAAEAELAASGDARVPMRAVGGRRTGSALVLVEIGRRTLALVADEDARALRVLDPDTHLEQATVALAGKPAQIAIGGDGRAYVSLRDAGAVVALEAEAPGSARLRDAGAITTATEPTGLAVSPDGGTLAIASSWGARLAAVAIPSRAPLFDVAVAREPRGVAIAGDYVYVSHAIGSDLTRVPLRGEARVEKLPLGGRDHEAPAPGEAAEKGGTPRAAGQGFSLAPCGDEVLAPGVLIHRGSAETGGYGTSVGFPAHEAAVAEVAGRRVLLRAEEQAFLPEKARLPPEDEFDDTQCILPRAIDVDPAQQTFYVACMGIDEVIAYRAHGRDLASSRIGSVHVPAGPAGVAVDAERSVLYVWSSLARTFSSTALADLAAGEPPEARRSTPLRLPPSAPALSTAVRLGRIVFHSPSGGRVSADGRACASCHPDGREDGMTWPTPDGPRQTPMLAGRLEGTGPYGWQGSGASLEEHLRETTARLGGTGLDARDVEWLSAYLREVPTPATPDGDAGALVARGKELFFTDTIGCASCHVAGGGSDGARHEVGSGVPLETPSLRFVAGTAPYFHDGRYATLADLLHGTRRTMGWAPDLADGDLAALQAYLRTL